MSLSLSCPCGARFEVEETFAGQAVSCPECQASVQAPALTRGPVRTSGYAVASVVLALVLACTGVGTLLAALLGGIALVQIKHHRGQLAGTGFAVFGIVAGLLFTAGFGLMLFQGEIFGAAGVRELLMGKQVDRSGALEVTRKEDDYAVTRPSPRWGVAKKELAARLVPLSSLVLIDLDRDGYLDVSVDRLDWGRTLEQYRDDVVKNLRDEDDFGGKRKSGPRGSPPEIRQQTRLPNDRGLERVEVLVDVRLTGQPMRFLIRVVRPVGSDRVYILRGWAQKRRFAELEPEIRQALDSFRLLSGSE